MASEKYNLAVKNLLRVIDIAIEVVKKYPPRGFEKKHLSLFIDNYNDIRNMLNKPNPKFMKMSSLKYKIEDVFIYFQEASGETVNEFWKRINKEGLPYKRVNKMQKLLKRGKIKNDIEFDYIIDTIVPLEQEGIINTNDVIKLNEMIFDFENRRK